MRLNLGCGRRPLAGWTNVDIVALPGVDLVADLNDCGNTPLPFPGDVADSLAMSHVLEHIPNSLPLMQELWRVAKPGADLTIRVPHGASDDAFEDPTHVHQYFVGSFGYFGQPYYWRADYGYRGDWQIESLTLSLRSADHPDRSFAAVMARVDTLRNQVLEMTAVLRAVKPARPPDRSLQTRTIVHFAWDDQ